MKLVNLSEIQLSDIVEFTDGTKEVIAGISNDKLLFKVAHSYSVAECCSCNTDKNLKSYFGKNSAHVLLEPLNKSITKIYRLEVGDKINDQTIDKIDINDGMINDKYINSNLKSIDFNQVKVQAVRQDLVEALTKKMIELTLKKDFELGDQIQINGVWHTVIGLSTNSVFIEDSKSNTTLNSLTNTAGVGLVYRTEFKHQNATELSKYGLANTQTLHIKHNDPQLKSKFKVGDIVHIYDGSPSFADSTVSKHAITKVEGQYLHFYDHYTVLSNPKIVVNKPELVDIRLNDVISIEENNKIKNVLVVACDNEFYYYAGSDVTNGFLLNQTPNFKSLLIANGVGFDLQNTIVNKIPKAFAYKLNIYPIHYSFSCQFKVGDLIDISHFGLVDKVTKVIAIDHNGSAYFKASDGSGTKATPTTKILFKDESYDESKDNIRMIAFYNARYIKKVNPTIIPTQEIKKTEEPQIEKEATTQKSPVQIAMFTFPHLDLDNILKKLDLDFGTEIDQIFDEFLNKHPQGVLSKSPEQVELFTEYKKSKSFKSELKESGYRIFSRKISKLFHKSIVALLKQHQFTSKQIEAIKMLLDTEYGRAFESYLIGMFLQNSKYAKNPHVEKILEELRVEGVLITGENILSSISSILFSALSSLPQEQRVRVQASLKDNLKNNDEEEEEILVQELKELKA